MSEVQVTTGPVTLRTAPRHAISTETETETERRRADLDKVMNLMRPAVQADGGELVLVSTDFDTGTVTVRLEGACGSSAISSATLKGGVERILKDRLPWVTEVVGEVDDSMDFLESSSLGRGGYTPRSGA